MSSIVRGRLKVDARRALDKLREHLLVDPRLYLTEIARSAVASGATRLDIAWDADDISLSCDAPPPSEARVTRLFDHLLSAGAGDEAPLRLLGLGVNAALGQGARRVEVHTAGEGGARVVNFTPKVVRGKGFDGLPPLPNSTAVRAPATWRVRVRKRRGWAVLQRAVVGTPHDELELLLELASDLHLPLAVTPPVPSRRAGAPILHVPVAVAGATRAFVEIDAGAGPGSIDFLEHGLRLVRRTWTVETFERAPLSSRLVVDTNGLETNASRSALAEDAALARVAREAGVRGLTRGVEALSALVAGTPPSAEDLRWAPAPAEDAREVLGHAAAAVVEQMAAGREVAPPWSSLLELPLLCDATGAPRAVKDFAFASPLWVLRRDAPLPVELAPWLGSVVWLRGSSVERALSKQSWADAEPIVERARLGLARRRAWLAHPPVTLSLAASPAELGRRRLRENRGDLAGLEIEVAVIAPDRAPLSSRVLVHSEGRVLDALAFDRAAMPLPIEAVLQWDGHLRPNFDHTGVERDAALARAVSRVVELALGVADQRLSRSGAEIDGLARASLLSLATHFEQTPERADPSWPERFPSLARWPGIQTSDGRKITAIALRTWAGARGALCVAAPGTFGAAPDRRPVVNATLRDAALLATLCRGSVTVVPYDRALVSRHDAATQRQTLQSLLSEQGVGAATPQVAIDRGSLRGILAVARRAVSAESHAGIPCSRQTRPALLGPRVAVLDDDDLVASGDFAQVLLRPVRAWWDMDQQLCEAVVAGLEGDPSRLAAGSVAEVGDPVVISYLLESLAKLDERAEQLAERKANAALITRSRALAARIRALPLLPWLNAIGQPELASVDAIRACHGSAVPMIDRLPGFETGEWRPVMITDLGVRDALKWIAKDAYRGDVDLESWRRVAERESARRALEQRPRREPLEPPEGALDGSPRGKVVRPRETAVVALSQTELAADTPAVELLVNGALVTTLPWSETGLPLLARIDLGSVEHIEALSRPSATGRELMRELAREATLDLASALTTRGGTDLAEDRRALTVLAAVARLDDAARSRVAGELAASTATWPTASGDAVVLAALVREDAEVWWSHREFSDWDGDPQVASDLDRPVLLAPDSDAGRARRALLDALGHALRDVTAAMEQLAQHRRGVVAVPRLDGTPLHPALRMDLRDLGVSSAWGEVEVLAAPPSTVTLVGLDGRSRAVGADLTPPLRAQLRWERVEDSNEARVALLSDVVEAVWRRLFDLAALDDPPPLVRDVVRGFACRRLVSDRPMPKRVEHAKVFPDITGAHRSLRELHGTLWRTTTMSPPHPARGYQHPILVLTVEEQAALMTRVKLRGVDKRLRADLRAEERARSPRVENMALSPEARARCWLIAAVDEEGTQGEVGLIAAPVADPERGIALHVDRRPLGVLDDGPGWPLVASVNDDSVRPNRSFTGPRSKQAREAIRGRVRAAATRALRESLEPSVPSPKRWLEEEPVFAGTRVSGYLSLMPRLAARPNVILHLSGRERPIEGPLMLELPAGDGALPITGELLLSMDGGGKGLLPIADATGMPRLAPSVHAALAQRALAVACQLLDEHGAEMSEHERVQLGWTLALLGADVPVTTRTADGQVVDAALLRRELSERRSVWITRHQGDADGDFPESLPGFVLRADDPLTAVLALRAPQTVRELGALDAAKPARGSPPRPSASDVADPTRQAFVQRGVAPLEAIAAAVRGLRLTADPIQTVVPVSGGAPLAFDGSKRQLSFDPAYWAPLLATASRDRGTLSVFLSAVVSEINRKLGSVTEAEERGLLCELLASA